MNEEEQDNTGDALPPEPSASPENNDDNSQVSMLRKQLYQRDESKEIEQRRKTLSTPSPVKKHKLEQTSVKPNLVDVVAQRSRKRRKILRGASLILLFFVILAGATTATLLYRRTQQVTQDQINLSIKVDDNVIAGQTSAYNITYNNDSHIRWENVQLVVDLPAGMKVSSVSPDMKQTARQQYTLDVGSLDAGKGGTAQINGQFIGEQGASLLARANVSFAPENLPQAQFNKSEAATTTIASVPLEISIESPNKAAAGERVPLVLHIRNTGSERFAATKLKLEPAPGVQLATEDDAFSPDFSAIEATWTLPPIDPLQEVTRTAVVYLSGASSERRVVTARAIVSQNDNDFAIRSVDQVFTISASELALAQTYNGSSDPQVVQAGDTIDATVTYQNTGTTALTNAVVKVAFEGASIDPGKIDLQSGAYDPTTKTITWKAASVPELATLLPQQRGEIKYKFGILDTDSFPKDDSAKNQNLIVTATIDSPSLPERDSGERAISDRQVLPVATNLALAVDAFYDDGRLGITSSGPLPPEVGKTTTYTLRFRFGTTLNDVGDVVIKAVLPEAVTYTNNTYKTDGEVDYNDRTNEIMWKIPFVEGLAGRNRPGPELDVQVAITPGQNLQGTKVQLIQSASTQAVDQFVDQSVQTEVSKDNLPDTEDAASGKGTVQ